MTADGFDHPMDERLRAITVEGISDDPADMRIALAHALELLTDARAGMRPQLTDGEQRALDASAELANAMRAIMPGIGYGSGVADHDWNEVCRSVHDVQARIMAIAASRIGLPCRPLGATEEATAEWIQLVRTTEPL